MIYFKRGGKKWDMDQKRTNTVLTRTWTKGWIQDFDPEIMIGSGLKQKSLEDRNL